MAEEQISDYSAHKTSIRLLEKIVFIKKSSERTNNDNFY